MASAGERSHSSHEHNHFALWELGAALITLILFARYALEWVKHQYLLSQSRRTNAKSEASRELEVGVSGLTCQGCVRRLEGNLLSREDVEMCAVNDKLDSLKVQGPIDLAELKDAVISSGFEIRNS